VSFLRSCSVAFTLLAVGNYPASVDVVPAVVSGANDKDATTARRAQDTVDLDDHEDGDPKGPQPSLLSLRGSMRA
jgi:hypothetical protein